MAAKKHSVKTPVKGGSTARAGATRRGKTSAKLPKESAPAPASLKDKGPARRGEVREKTKAASKKPARGAAPKGTTSARAAGSTAARATKRAKPRASA